MCAKHTLTRGVWGPGKFRLFSLSEVIPEPVSANCNMVTIQYNIQHMK